MIFMDYLISFQDECKEIHSYILSFLWIQKSFNFIGSNYGYPFIFIDNLNDELCEVDFMLFGY